MRKFRRRSIFLRLLGAFTVVGVAIGAPLIYLSVDFTRSSTERRAEQNATQQMEIIGANFDQEMSANLRRSVQFIVSSDVLTSYLSASRFEQMIIGKKLETLFLRISEQHEDISGVYFFDRDGVAQVGTEDGRRNVFSSVLSFGQNAAAASDKSPTQERMQQAFETVRAVPLLLSSGNMEWFMPPQEVQVGDIYLDAEGRLSLLAALPVLDNDNGSFGGVVFIRQRLDRFADRLQSVMFFDENPVWLFAEDGSILMRPEDPEITFDPRRYLSAEFSAGVSVGNIDDGLIVHRDLAIAPGESSMRIVFAIPSQLLMRDFAPTMRILVVILLASVVLAAWFAYSVSREVSRPIIELAKAASRLAEGDLSTRVKVRAIGEVEVLVRSFNQMSSNLQLADSNRSRAEARLLTAMRQAEMANAAKTDFLATMSHEIRTPMNGILGTLNLLKSTELDQRQCHYMDNIRDSANGLLVILNDILDISKIESNSVELEKVDFLLHPMIGAAFDLMRDRAEEKGLDYSLEVAPGLPAALVGDPTRLRQIVLNFISNAIKFTSSGSIRVQVESLSEDDSSTVLKFRIADTGCGIAPEKTGQIFEKFSQADTSTTRQYGGTGLGLSISRQLVELMGGEVGVSSEPGRGSEFWFTVRLALGKTEGAVDPSREDSADAAFAATPRGLRILVAEDHPINQEIVRDTLGEAGHSVDLVSNGLEAVAAVKGGGYDIVLMDIHMPKMDGQAAARAIRALPGPEADVPIIALTADAMVGVREEMLACGMDSYVSKPFTPNALFNAISRHASRGAVEAGNDNAPGACNADRGQETAPEADPVLIDPEIADPLRIGKNALWRNIVGIYLETTPHTLTVMQKGIEARDAQAVRASAHTLKSASANIGAMSISHYSRSIEESAEIGDLAKAAAQLIELRQCHEAVAELLTSELEQTPLLGAGGA